MRKRLLATVMIVGCASPIPLGDVVHMKPPEEFADRGQALLGVTEAEAETPPSKGQKAKAVKPIAKPAERARDYLPPNPRTFASVPFKVGERLQYVMEYLGMKGGLATIEVRPMQKFLERPAFFFWGHIRSSPIVDLFYKVDDSIDVLVDQQTLLPLRGSFDLRESIQLKQRVVLYKHRLGKAAFWSKRISAKKGPEDINREDVMTPGAQEMFSALFYLRTVQLKMGKKIEMPIYENNKNWTLVVEGIKEEEVDTQLGTFPCVVSRLQVAVGGILQQRGDIYMWTTNDAENQLIKFSAKVKIGNMQGRLIRRGTTDEPLNLSM